MRGWFALAALAAVLGAFGAGYVKGHGDADKACTARALAAELERARRDLDAADHAVSVAKAVEAAAARRAEELKRELDAHEQALAVRGDDCRNIDRAADRRLCRLAGGGRRCG